MGKYRTGRKNIEKQTTPLKMQVKKQRKRREPNKGPWGGKSRLQPDGAAGEANAGMRGGKHRGWRG